MARFPRLDMLFGRAVAEWDESVLAEAVESAVRENADLDWKEQPYAKYDRVAEEIGKDVAAMANAGGGILVFGVQDRAGHAVELKPFDVALWPGAEQRILHSVADKVAPPPLGLSFLRIPATSRPGAGYLVAMISRSLDTPHAVRVDDALRYPVRDADQTRTLSESEVAARYRDRFRLRQERQDRLDQVHTEAAEAVQRRDRILLSLTLVPDVPGRAPVGKQGVQDLRAWIDDPPWFPSPLAFEWNAIRLGLRKTLGSAELSELGTADWAHVELHEEGSAAVVVDLSRGGLRMGRTSIGGKAPGNTAAPLLRHLEATIIGGLSLAVMHAVGRARCSGDAAVRVELAAADGWILTLAEPTPISGEDRRHPSARYLRGGPARVHETVSLDAAGSSTVELLIAAQHLCADLVSIFGVGPEALAIDATGRLDAARFGRESASVAAWLDAHPERPAPES